MIYIIIFLTFLITLLYFFKVKMSKGIIIFVYLIYFLNLLYELFKKIEKGSTDYNTYLSGFAQIRFVDFKHLLDVNIFEPLFRYFAWLILQIVPNDTYVILVFIINFIIAVGIYKFFDDKYLSVFALLIYTYGPLFLPMSANIIRQMLAMSLILLFFKLKGIKKIWLLILPFIHASSIFIVLILIIQKYIKVKFSIIIFICSLILYLSKLNQKIFGSLSILDEYTSAQAFRAYGGEGDRLDFLLLTLCIVLLGLYLYKVKAISSKFINYILLTAAVFCLLGFQAFSERIAIYNWFFVILLLPIFLNFIIRRTKF